MFCGSVTTVNSKTARTEQNKSVRNIMTKENVEEKQSKIKHYLSMDYCYEANKCIIFLQN